MDPFDPLQHAWDAWRPGEAARRLRGLEVPWYVAAGWAIDLFLGEQRREHEDLEIGTPAARFPEIAAALGELEFFAIVDGKAQSEPQEDSHQTWGFDRSAGVWRIDVFREPWDGDTWVCRREPSIRYPRGEQIEWTPDGIPYLRPELVLLFKAKHARPKDEDDFAAVLPALAPERKRRFAELLTRVHPGHRWLHRL
jgi:aminoglycoside-2''-adenylyltransferase